MGAPTGMRGNTSGVLRRMWLDEAGQDLAEYGIALAVIGTGMGFGAWFIGLIVAGMWEQAEQQVVTAAGGS